MIFFVNEVSFANVVKVMDFDYVFENGLKCNVLWISMFFVLFCMFGKVTIESELFFVSEVNFENVVKVLGLAYVFKKGKKCNCLLSSCFCGFWAGFESK